MKLESGTFKIEEKDDEGSCTIFIDNSSNQKDFLLQEEESRNCEPQELNINIRKEEKRFIYYQEKLRLLHDFSKYIHNRDFLILETIKKEQRFRKWIGQKYLTQVCDSDIEFFKQKHIVEKRYKTPKEKLYKISYLPRTLEEQKAIELLQKQRSAFYSAHLSQRRRHIDFEK